MSLPFGDSSAINTLQLLVGAGNGTPEMLLLLDKPNAEGVVRVRSWTSDDWSATPETRDLPKLDLLREIEGWARQRRRLNHQIAEVRRWLGFP